MRALHAFPFVILLLGSVGCRHEQVVKVLGDHGTQPPTVVTTRPAGSSADVGPVIVVAKRAVEGYPVPLWPERSRVIEAEAYWTVFFDHREQVTDIDGQQAVRHQIPNAVNVRIHKAGLVTELIRVR